MSTAPSNSGVNVNELDDLHKKYQEALSRNTKAKSRLADLQSATTDLNRSSKPFVKPVDKHASRQRHLESHLENLRLQKQCKGLQTLSHFTREAEKIGEEEEKFETLNMSLSHQRPNDSVKTNITVTLTHTQQHLASLLDVMKTRTASLELALVKARQQLKIEQTLLERVKAYSRGWANGTTKGKDVSAEQRAMEATREQLQSWIGQCLAKCEQDASHHSLIKNGNMEVPDVTGQVSENDETSIDAEYKNYLETRSQLVEIARVLRAPLPSLELEMPSRLASNKVQGMDLNSGNEEQKQNVQLQRAPHLRHKSRISVNKILDQSNGPSLSKIESTHLPEYHHEKLLNTYVDHLIGQIGASDSRLLQRLGLLSHESHLLPSYPSSAADRPSSGINISISRQQSEVDELLGAWAFASNEADGLLRDNVLTNVEEAKLALERAAQSVDEIDTVKRMQKEVYSIS